MKTEEELEIAARIRQLHKELESAVTRARSKGMKVAFTAANTGTFSGPINIQIWKDQAPLVY